MGCYGVLCNTVKQRGMLCKVMAYMTQIWVCWCTKCLQMVPLVRLAPGFRSKFDNNSQTLKGVRWIWHRFHKGVQGRGRGSEEMMSDWIYCIGQISRWCNIDVKYIIFYEHSVELEVSICNALNLANLVKVMSIRMEMAHPVLSCSSSDILSKEKGCS